MKQKINLRLEVAGSESLLPLFDNCLKSYLKYFDIGELLIYTTDNLIDQVYKITSGIADKILIYDVEKYYVKNKDKFPKVVNGVLDYSKDKYWVNDKERKMIYLYMMYVMDYYLIDNKSFICSDIDVRILNYTKPIVDWINSDYILYNADFLDDYYAHNPKIVEKFGGETFFELLPKFNCGFICIPKGIKINVEELFKIVKYDCGDWCAIQTAMAVSIIKNKIKTKLLPRELMVTKDEEIENKTLAHQSPYGLLRK